MKDILSRKNIVILLVCLLLSSCVSSSSNRVSDGGLYYRITSGETLYDLSRRTGLLASEIMNANGLTSPYLNAGQVIYLPFITEYPEPPIITGKQRPAQIRPLPKIIPKDLDHHVDPIPTTTGLPKLAIIRRHAWGALPPKANHNPMNGVKKITVHHTSEYPGMNALSDHEIVKGIANHHRGKRGWADIGYHYLIGRNGAIYEGRSEHLQGAHTRNNNSHNLGISLIGNFDNYAPSAKQLESLQKLLKYKKIQYQISNAQVFGHRDHNATACPGHHLYKWLGNYRISD